jgi:Xaa-Pro aminopeptidase
MAQLPPAAVLARRLAQVRQALTERHLDALVVTTPANIRYLSNHVGTAGILVIAADDVSLLIDFRYREAAQTRQASEAACPGLRVVQVAASYEAALVDHLASAGLARVGFEASELTVARHGWLVRTLASRQVAVALEPTERVVERLRMVKDAYEIERLRDAAARLSPVADRAFQAVRPGVAERAVAAAIEAALREAGFERPAFDTIVASGPNAALPHHRAGDRLLASGDAVVLDFGGVLDGYCSDLTCTVSVGTPSPDLERVYASVLAAQQAAIRSVRPGIAAHAVDAAAREVLESTGLGEAFGHGTGHGLGLDVHEEPRIARFRTDTTSVGLEPGMVFTVEPGAYLPAWGGVRIEDDVLVTQDGCEVLTSVPRDLRACG